MLLFWYRSCASDLTYIFTKHRGLTSSHLLTYHAIKYDALPQLKPITTTPPPPISNTYGLQIINVKFLKEDPLPPTQKPFSLPSQYWYYMVHTSACVNIEIHINKTINLSKIRLKISVFVFFLIFSNKHDWLWRHHWEAYVVNRILKKSLRSSVNKNRSRSLQYKMESPLFPILIMVE